MSQGPYVTLREEAQAEGDLGHPVGVNVEYALEVSPFHLNLLVLSA